MKKKDKIPTLNQDFELETFLTVLRKNVIFVVIFFAIAISGGYLYYRYTQPTYSSSSVIQIKKENKTREILGISNEVKMEPTIEIMRSEEFLKTVIKNLPLGISFFTEGAFLTTENYGSTPINIEYTITGSGIYDTPIYYERNSDEKSYDINIGKDSSSCQPKLKAFLKVSKLNEKRIRPKILCVKTWHSKSTSPYDKICA